MPVHAIALIPARLDASRFPKKMLASISGKSVIRRTYESALATGLFDEVVVVTDSDEIEAEIRLSGGTVFRSTKPFESGTDRIAEAAADRTADVFVNVQGDEPFVQREPLAQLLELFDGEDALQVQVASLVQELKDPQLIADPNYVKVALDLRGNALFFSRSPIPYVRDANVKLPYYEHIGVYAFRKEALIQFTRWEPTPLERTEKIECLRFLEHGVPLRMAITEYMGVEIDHPEDIVRAEALLQAQKP
jgi:3-deoxy-D-manno-octulosonate cytidylyltransferase